MFPEEEDKVPEAIVVEDKVVAAVAVAAVITVNATIPNTAGHMAVVATSEALAMQNCQDTKIQPLSLTRWAVAATTALHPDGVGPKRM
jgi:hypothetical protein